MESVESMLRIIKNKTEVDAELGFLISQNAHLDVKLEAIKKYNRLTGRIPVQGKFTHIIKREDFSSIQLPINPNLK